MGREFLACVKNGGKVITKDIGKDKYMHICILAGKSFPGEVKTKKAECHSDMKDDKMMMEGK